MGEPVPIMDEPTHDRITNALLHLKMERPQKARDELHRALDRLEGSAEWLGHSAIDYRVAYGESPIGTLCEGDDDA